MAEVDSVVAKLSLDIAQFSKGIKDAQRQMDTFAKDSKDATSGISQSFLSMGQALKGALGFAGITLGVQGAIEGFKQLAASVITLGEDLQRTSVQTGINVQDLSALRLALELNDTNLQTFSSALRVMQVNLADAARGSGDAAEVMERMGITLTQIEQAAGDPQGFLELFARRLFEIQDAGTRAEAASKVFGRSVLELMPFLQDLSERGLKGVQAEARRLGVIMSDEMAAAADAFGDNMTRVKIAAQAAAAVIGGPLLTALNRAASAMGLIEEAPMVTSLRAIDLQINRLKTSTEELKAGLSFEGGGLYNAFRRGLSGSVNPEQMRQDLATQEAALESLRKVREQLTTALPKTGGGVTGPTGIDKATKALEVQLAQITKNSQVMGQAYDALAAKESAYRKAIEDTTKLQGKEAVAPEDPRLKALGATHAALVTQIKAREDAEKASTKAISDADRDARQEQRDRLQDLVEFTRESQRDLAEEARDLARRVTEVSRDVETPMDAFARGTQELLALQPHLPVETFDRAVQKLVDDLAKATDNTQYLKDVQDDAARTVASLASPTEQYRLALAALNDQLDTGGITQAQFAAKQEQFNAWLYEALHQTKDLDQSWRELGGALEDAFLGAVVQGRSFGDVILGLTQDIERLVLKALVLEPLMKSLGELTQGKGLGELLKSGLSAIGSGISGLFGGGGGGIEISGSAPTSIVGLQHGGLFSRPTLAMLAESGSPEVVMPVHKMEAWMQGVMAGIEPGGTAVSVVVNNNAPNTVASTKQRTGPQGERSVEVVIDEAVANTLSRQGTQSRRVLRAQYGATPTLIGR